ncbi:hypothetical protein [Pedobacter sp. UBA5917]|jgi:hypothetical protein|uniref:hypothetical protein n=1 Tax=Pedobacter sp. UBA5917 TaxID=1947061 RepID=UPI0025FA5C2B|nr:hypothetical protein [Pedobacter sp. UBA5917]
MSQTPTITDAYIDEIIKAPDAYNPTLNKTQGVKLRELIKLMRDEIEQDKIEGKNFPIPVTYLELMDLITTGMLRYDIPYLLTDFYGKFIYFNSDLELINEVYVTDNEPLILNFMANIEGGYWDEINNTWINTLTPVFKGKSLLHGDYIRYTPNNRIQGYLLSEKGEIIYREDKLKNRKSTLDFRNLKYKDVNDNSIIDAININTNSELTVPNIDSNEYYTLGQPLIIAWMVDSVFKINHILGKIKKIKLVKSNIQITGSGYSTYTPDFDEKLPNFNSTTFRNCNINVTTLGGDFADVYIENVTTPLVNIMTDGELKASNIISNSEYIFQNNKTFRRYIDEADNTQKIELCI